ncbi:MAG: type III-A CRISPR-associated protein Cas10/Csm1 [Candidatus Promineifilaceae bacterium]
MSDLQDRLISEGIWQLGQRLNKAQEAEALAPRSEDWIAYKQVLRPQGPINESGQLKMWLSLVYPEDKKNEIPAGKEKERPNRVNWKKFEEVFAQLPQDTHRFEAFSHLMRQFGDDLPGFGDGRVSLYTEWQALAALAFASGGTDEPAENFLLVGGDTSGIQDFLYNVTYEGAAKGLRGRSLFLQLVSDGVVRGLLKALDLPWVNVVYMAGGNFLLLASAGSAEKVAAYQDRVNEALMTATQGRLRLTLGWAKMPAKAAADPKAWQESVRAVRQKQGEAKLRPFAGQFVFAPFDEGGEVYCAICHRGVEENEDLRKWDQEEGKDVCPLCSSFKKLADSVRHEKLWMVVKEQQAGNARTWQDVLTAVSGYHYQFTEKKPDKAGGFIYAINQPDFWEVGAHGYRALANVTPLVTDGDLNWWRDQPEGKRPDYEGGEPHIGQIRDFDLMVRDAEGVKWLGVLRMDVDSLGAVFTQWLPERAMMGTAVMSREMETFFSQNLNEIVREHATINDGEKRLAAYIIYAGGDDLFIVGAWHLLPELAEAIHTAFHNYTGNEYLTISAGISLMPRTKMPLYLAADEAKDALDDKAKGRRWVLAGEKGTSKVYRRWYEKNAICFLDTVVGWPEWKAVQTLAEKLVAMERDGMPRALIQTMRQIYATFEKGRKDYEREYSVREENEVVVYPAYYGRWQWLTQYQFARMKHRYKAFADDLDWLRQEIEKPEVTAYTGLAARWAEFLTRKKNDR